jgi:hypothetical protein
MTIILALCIPVTAIVTGFFVLKAVQLGLRWQIQTAKQEQPSMEIQNPIQLIVEERQQEKQEKEQANILYEWLNGASER